MKKAIFLDIDGTLIDCMNGMNDISDRVKKSIRKVQENGDYVFIATGRPYALLNENLLDFGFNGFILANGAHVILDNKTIYSEALSKKFIKILVSKLEEREIQYILQSELYSYLKDEYIEFHQYYDKIGVSKKYFKNEFDLNEIDVHKIEMLCNDNQSKELCLSIIKENSECDYFSSVNKSALEVYLKKNTKASAILNIIEKLNISIDNTYAFGDGKNDIEMLSIVGCGIVMGNASTDVKYYADKITDDVENDGVAIGIEKYVYC